MDHFFKKRGISHTEAECPKKAALVDEITRRMDYAELDEERPDTGWEDHWWKNRPKKDPNKKVRSSSGTTRKPVSKKRSK
jgi:hypothetical protein